MDKQQFATLAIGIKSAYPASKILEDNASMDFWYMTLKDIPYEIAENAVMEHICTNIYPPNIAEIRKLCMERCKTPILSFDEAWGVVRKAMSDYGWYHPQEAFATMDELTLAVVKNLGRIGQTSVKLMRKKLLKHKIQMHFRISSLKTKCCCKSSMYRQLRRKSL